MIFVLGEGHGVHGDGRHTRTLFVLRGGPRACARRICHYVQWSMALPATLAHFSPALAKAGVRLGSALRPEDQGLSLGIDGLDAVLPDQGILRGGVVELAVSGPS